MKAIYKTIRRDRFDWRLPENTLLSQSTVNAIVDWVAPGAIVHGNHRDPNSWDYLCIREQLPKGEITVWEGVSKYKHQYRGWFGDSTTYSKQLSWDRTTLYNQALNRLNEKVRGTLDLAVSLAEAGSTARMIGGIRNVLDFARGRRWSTKDIANGWLQWQYGWKPLLSDVFEACDTGNRSIRKSLGRVNVSATNLIRENSFVDKQVLSVPYRALLTAEGKQSCRMQVWLEIRPQDFDIAEWASLNPVSLAWELIPYSFVVDWFYDVGSYMRNLETALLYGTVFKNGFVSELNVYDSKEVGGGDKPYHYGPDSFGTWRRVDYMEARMRWRQFVRTKLTSYPLPRKPTFQVDLGSQRLFSAASLLRQLLK